jgi:YVTN family beta-propeller protein
MKNRFIFLIIILFNLLFSQNIETRLFFPDSFSGLREPIAVIYNPLSDKIYIAADKNNALLILDGATDDKIARLTIPTTYHYFQGVNPYPSVVNTVNNKVYIASVERLCITVIDGMTNQVVTTIPLPTNPVALTYNPTNNKIYCAVNTVSYPQTPRSSWVLIIDGEQDIVTDTIPVGRDVRNLVLNPSNNKLYVANRADHNISVIDCSINQVIRTVDIPGYLPMYFAYNSTNNRILVYHFYTPDSGRCASIIDGNADTVIATTRFSGGGYIYDEPGKAEWNPVNNKYYVGSPINTIAVIDGSTNQLLKIIDVSLSMHHPNILVNQAENKIYIQNGNIWVIDGANDSIIESIPAGVTTAVLNPLRNKIYGTNPNYADKLAVVDCQTDSVIKEMVIGGWVSGAFYHPIRNKLYCFSEYGVIAVYDGNTFRAMKTVVLPEGELLDTQLNNPFAWNERQDLIYFGVIRENVPESSYIAVFNPESDSIVQKFFSLNYYGYEVLWHSTRNKVYFADGLSGIFVIDSTFNIRWIDTNSAPIHLCLNLTNDELYAATSTPVIINCETDSVIGNIPDNHQLNDWVWNPRNNMLYCKLFDEAYENVFYVYDCTNRAIRYYSPSIWVNSHGYFVALSPKSNKVYVTTETGNWGVCVMNCWTNEFFLTYEGLEEGPMLVDTGGNKVYKAYGEDGDGMIAVIDDIRNMIIRRISVPGLSGSVSGDLQMTFDPNHQRLFGPEIWEASVTVIRDQVGLDEQASAPRKHLRINLNPFRIATSIQTLEDSEIEIYNSVGQLVRKFAKSKDIVWDGKGMTGARLPAGVYILCLKSYNATEFVKVIKLN